MTRFVLTLLALTLLGLIAGTAIDAFRDVGMARAGYCQVDDDWRPCDCADPTADPPPLPAGYLKVR